MSVTMDVPEPDHEGFVSWVENEYTTNRWSYVDRTLNPHTGGSVVVRSGEYPVYNRFIKDLRPILHEYGFVISFARKSQPSLGIETHVIKAIPVLWVVAYANGWVCRRGACRHVTADVYCDDCGQHYDDPDRSREPYMVNP